ncbi:MAG: VanZ family protein [Rhodobacteraceae bacterium]|nr:VanZ family protein [Paracoccaceae bacterium]
MLNPPPIAPHKRRAAVIAAILLLVLVTGLLLMPVPDHGLKTPKHIDKLVHFIVFFCVAFPAFLGKIRLWPLTMIALIIYGGVIELIQPQFGRDADWIDFVANSLGVVAAFPPALAARYWIGSKHRQRAQRNRTNEDGGVADL